MAARGVSTQFSGSKSSHGTMFTREDENMFRKANTSNRI